MCCRSIQTMNFFFVQLKSFEKSTQNRFLLNDDGSEVAETINWSWWNKVWLIFKDFDIDLLTSFPVVLQFWQKEWRLILVCPAIQSIRSKFVFTCILVNQKFLPLTLTICCICSHETCIFPTLSHRLSNAWLISLNELRNSWLMVRLRFSKFDLKFRRFWIVFSVKNSDKARKASNVSCRFSNESSLIKSGQKQIWPNFTWSWLRSLSKIFCIFLARNGEGDWRASIGNHSTTNRKPCRPFKNG